jgi:glutamate N-acetyltransferase / amino-acid N-acetyltransferase
VSVTFPRGFRAIGATAGFKASGRPDLGLLVADRPAAAAGAFTTNRFPAAPVVLTRGRLASGRARAVLVNSGQANAGTGEAGLRDAEATAGLVSRLLEVRPEDVLVCSTGVIGPRVPLDRLRAALPAAAGGLTEEGGPGFARAILTTDPGPKEAVAETGPHRVGGCVKGAGMIGPRLATMLAFVTTDAPATPSLVRELMATLVAPAFNSVTVDGCQSTNDSVLLLAGGAAGGPALDRGDPQAKALAEAVEEVCRDLARQVAAEAEGARTTIVVHVEGAGDDDDARAVGLQVAGSPLVKAALHGGDPNPGRILQAVGDAPAAFDPSRVKAWLNDHVVVEAGLVHEPPSGVIDGAGPVIAITVGDGPGSATVFGCDLTEDYVRINAGYRT